jgi:hexosaminidase
MLDTSRRFYSVDSILQILRAMAAAKFNILHWHIVDDESFPMELKLLPNVTRNGAFRREEVYTHIQIKQIVEHAMRLAIRVVPEFDNPGHTRSVGLDPYFNDALLCFRDSNLYTVPGAYKINGTPHTSTLDPTNEKTYELLRGVFSEMNDLFPENMIHLGGDEVDQKCFDENPNIQNFMRYHQISDYGKLVVMHIEKARQLLAQ